MPLPQRMENYLQTLVFKTKQEYRNYHAESNKKNLLASSAATSIYFTQIGEKYSK